MKRVILHFRAGFTLVEVLTTIAIIGILLAFLVPAFNKVQKTAQTVRQKTQFHGLEIALEAVYTDMGDYPPSAWDESIYEVYSATQRLAEAVIGRDGFGVHKDTAWGREGKAAGAGLMDPVLYGAAAISDPDNLASRFGPYLELENANAVLLSSIYGSPIGSTDPLIDSYVLADMFKVTKHATTGKMGGMPILYYRADRTRVLHDASNPDLSTYNINDVITGTDDIVNLAVPFSGNTATHPMASDATWFYNRIQNPNFTTTPRPYRADSFILQSAGPDGLYGTADDIFNFDQDN